MKYREFSPQPFPFSFPFYLNLTHWLLLVSVTQLLVFDI